MEKIIKAALQKNFDSQEKFNPVDMATRLSRQHGLNLAETEQAIWLELATRPLRETLPLLETGPAKELPDLRALYVADDWSGFSQSPDRLEVDLQTSEKSQGVLRQLVEARLEGTTWVSVDNLLEGTWGEGELNKKKVYATVHRLRKNGLEIEHGLPGEYRLAPWLEPVFPSRSALEH